MKERTIKLPFNNESMTSENEYFRYVLEVDEMIKKRFPLGAIGLKEVVQSHQMPEDELKYYLDAFNKFQNIIKADDILISEIMNIAQTLLGADGRIMSNYALGYLKYKYPELLVEYLSISDQHAMIVIGREPDSDLEDPLLYGEKAIIYDGYLGQSYLASSFSKAEFLSIDTQVYSGVFDELERIQEIETLHGYDCLLGEPLLYATKSCQYVDDMMVEWVKKEQKIIEKTKVKEKFTTTAIAAPSSSSSPKKKHWVTEVGGDDCQMAHSSIFSPQAREDVKQIKDNLTYVTKCSGWKASLVKNFIYLECQDEKQHDRVLDILRATAVVVAPVSCHRRDNGAWVVKGTHIDVSLLARLAQSLKYSLPQEHLALINAALTRST